MTSLGKQPGAAREEGPEGRGGTERRVGQGSKLLNLLSTLAIHRNWAGWCPDSRKVPLTCEDATVEEASDARVRTPFW